MTREEEMLQLVLSVITEMGHDTSELTLETPLEDCGITSLEAIDLAFNLEEELNITINMEDFRVRTVGEAVSYLLERVLGAGTPASA